MDKDNFKKLNYISNNSWIEMINNTKKEIELFKYKIDDLKENLRDTARKIINKASIYFDDLEHKVNETKDLKRLVESVNIYIDGLNAELNEIMKVNNIKSDLEYIIDLGEDYGYKNEIFIQSFDYDTIEDGMFKYINDKIENNSRDYKLYYIRGKMHSELKNYGKAYKDYKKSLEILKKAENDIKKDIKDIITKIDDTLLSENYYKNDSFDFIEYCLEKGIHFYNTNNFKESRYYFDKVLKLDIENEEALKWSNKLRRVAGV